MESDFKKGCNTLVDQATTLEALTESDNQKNLDVTDIGVGWAGFQKAIDRRVLDGRQL